MIKINLLPKSINEKKIVRNTAILFGVLVVAVVAIGILYTQMFLVPKVEAKVRDAEAAEALKAEVEKIEGETATIKKDTEPIKMKLDFIKNVLVYNQEYPKLYEEVAKWTYEKISYSSMECDGTTVKMSAQARSLDDLGRFLLNMYRATDLFTEVTISGVPGYPMDSSGNGAQVQDMGLGPWSGGGGPQGNSEGIGAIMAGVQQGPHARYIVFSVDAKLKKPIAAPAFGTAGAAGGTPGAPGAPPAPGTGGPMGPSTPPPGLSPGGGGPAGDAAP
jgi:ribosomal protein L9